MRRGLFCNLLYIYNTGDIYEGDFKNNICEGKGILYYNDGDRYEGDFKNDEKEGKGIMYYKNGEKYEGDYKNGIREGKGIYHISQKYFPYKSQKFRFLRECNKTKIGNK